MIQSAVIRLWMMWSDGSSSSLLGSLQRSSKVKMWGSLMQLVAQSRDFNWIDYCYVAQSRKISINKELIDTQQK